jgi:hypothetical protein
MISLFFYLMLLIFISGWISPTIREQTGNLSKIFAYFPAGRQGRKRGHAWFVWIWPLRKSLPENILHFWSHL